MIKMHSQVCFSRGSVAFLSSALYFLQFSQCFFQKQKKTAKIETKSHLHLAVSNFSENKKCIEIRPRQHLVRTEGSPWGPDIASHPNPPHGLIPDPPQPLRADGEASQRNLLPLAPRAHARGSWELTNNCQVLPFNIFVENEPSIRNEQLLK